MKKEKIVIVTTGAFPVPAVKGGGAETLVEILLKQQEVFQHLDLTLLSIYDEEAVERSAQYPHTKFCFIRPQSHWYKLDGMIHHVAYDLLHRDNHLAFKSIFQRLDYIRLAAKYIHDRDFDKVVFENQMALLWALRYPGNQQKFADKYYLHIHNHPARYAGNEKLAADARKIICVSEFIGKAFAGNIGVPFDDRFAVLKNVADESLFDPAKVTEEDLQVLREKYSLGQERVILFCGRLIEGKGVRELLLAYEMMNRPDTKLVIVGSFNYNSTEKSPYEDKLMEILDRIGRDRVIFTGYIPHEELPKYYALADLVVLPSTCEEAAGLTVIEAMMMQRPVITTTMGGIPEYTNPECAVLLENDESLPEQIRNAMEDLLDSPVKCQAMKDAQKEYTKIFSLAEYYHRFVRILED